MTQRSKMGEASLLHGPTVLVCEVLLDMFITKFRKLTPDEQIYMLRKLVDSSIDAIENPVGDER